MDTADELVKMAQRGIWISLDGLRINESDSTESQEVINHHFQLLQALKENGLLAQVLISHDGNSFPRGGAIRPYEAIFTRFIPRLKKSGFTPEEIDQLLIENPQRAFAYGN
jgi:phosphotriesterase-related protein